MWGGANFGIGEEYFSLMRDIFSELVPVLDRECMIHVGLDEAVWSTLPSVAEERKEDYRPERLVGRLYDILAELGERHDRKITMHMWADHGGRPVPRELQGKVVIEPWRYHENSEKDIEEKIAQYRAMPETRFMMGAGMGADHFGGHFGATRLWCQMGREAANVEGVTICMWGSNDLAERLIGLYAGADYAWSPESPPTRDLQKDRYSENRRSEISRRMRVWQAVIRDADAEAINRDRGPEVFLGRYCWGKRAGHPAAPTGAIRPW
jgi:hypothetical protein